MVDILYDLTFKGEKPYLSIDLKKIFETNLQISLNSYFRNSESIYVTGDDYNIYSVIKKHINDMIAIYNFRDEEIPADLEMASKYPQVMFERVNDILEKETFKVCISSKKPLEKDHFYDSYLQVIEIRDYDVSENIIISKIKVILYDKEYLNNLWDNAYSKMIFLSEEEENLYKDLGSYIDLPEIQTSKENFAWQKSLPLEVRSFDEGWLTSFYKVSLDPTDPGRYIQYNVLDYKKGVNMAKNFDIDLQKSNIELFRAMIDSYGGQENWMDNPFRKTIFGIDSEDVCSDLVKCDNSECPGLHDWQKGYFPFSSESCPFCGQKNPFYLGKEVDIVQDGEYDDMLEGFDKAYALDEIPNISESEDRED